MDVISTKEKILITALDLFSKNGYDSVSVNDIADSIGIKAPSLYKHYSSKNEILVALLNKISALYQEKSIFTTTDFSDPNVIKSILNFKEEDIIKSVLTQFDFALYNETISKCRKMLTIMQFKDEYLKQIQDERSFYDILNYFKNMFIILIRNEKMVDLNPEVLSLEFFSPISMCLFLCDRNIDKYEYSVMLVKEHIHNFIRKYFK